MALTRWACLASQQHPDGRCKEALTSCYVGGDGEMVPTPSPLEWSGWRNYTVHRCERNNLDKMWSLRQRPCHSMTLTKAVFMQWFLTSWRWDTTTRATPSPLHYMSPQCLRQTGWSCFAPAQHPDQLNIWSNCHTSLLYMNNGTPVFRLSSGRLRLPSFCFDQQRFCGLGELSLLQPRLLAWLTWPLQPMCPLLLCITSVPLLCCCCMLLTLALKQQTKCQQITYVPKQLQTHPS